MKIGDRLREAERNAFVGREQELKQLLAWLEHDTVIVTFLHGIGGIGKSSLLRAFSEQARARGLYVVGLDCRDLKPSEEGFLEGLADRLGTELESVDAVGAFFESLQQPIVITLDTYELYRIMDPWFRNTLIPAMPDRVRFVISGREADLASWLSAPGWHSFIREIKMTPLPSTAARTLLAGLGVDTVDAERILKFAGGHPLALKLAARSVAQHPQLDIQPAETVSMVEELARIYLMHVEKPVNRRILEAASVVRRVTRPLLAAMLPELNAEEAYQSLVELPFVEQTREGLLIHDMVRQAFSILLSSSAPGLYRSYRLAAGQS